MKTAFNDSMLEVAKRENNKIRSWVLVNKVQAKHIPVSPRICLSVFEALSGKLRDKYSNENILVIGFAETATAIGAYVAASLFENTKYIHTTRIFTDENTISFSEEHSHATQHKLIISEKFLFADIERIIFVEDEITTGKTIINFIHQLEKLIDPKIKYCVASLVNNMNDHNLENFRQNDIDITYLIKLNRTFDFNRKVENIMFDEGLHTDFSNREIGNIDIIDINGKVDVRNGCFAKLYLQGCKNFANELFEKSKAENYNDKKLLILGTEEFMYLPILFADLIETRLNKSKVFTHSTTRSPIIASKSIKYPVYKRYHLMPVYKGDYNTFIYNLEHYDKTFVITDSDDINMKGISDIYYALLENGCKDVSFVRWVK